ncbi:MAG: 2-succinyl-5-enolpyruvyl-6-hydroxy-3-cyclohexene-1-carboxylic-acid synthase [Acidimicrobiales bacterium]
MSASELLASVLVDALARQGLRSAVASPGSRSAPLALALAEHPAIELTVLLDERSAGFFALGAAKATAVPSAVLVTSGTAVANLHPAVLEAHHSATPLLVITADRPPELRDTGANQTIDQARIFGTALRWYTEVAPAPDAPVERYLASIAMRAMAEASGPPAGPVQMNIPLPEPLVDPARQHSRRADGRGTGEASRPSPGSERRRGGAPLLSPSTGDVSRLADLVARSERGVIVAGPRPAWRSGDDAFCAAFSAATGWPVLADPLSQLRSGPSAVSTYDLMLRDRRFASAQVPETVVRIGATPTSTAVVSWMSGLPATVEQVLVSGQGDWADPARSATWRVAADEALLLEAVTEELRGEPGRAGRERGWAAGWALAEAACRQALDGLLDSYDEPSEPRVARDLVDLLPRGTALVCGSSMPVRDVDSFSRPRGGLMVTGNRGVSGIDGYASTVLGVASVTTPAVGLVGDLSLLHDLSGLLAAGRRGVDAVLVVVDNDGGGIFSMLPYADLAERHEELFAAPQGTDIAAIATACGAEVSTLKASAELGDRLEGAISAGGLQLVLVPTDRSRNVDHHAEAMSVVAQALERLS